MFYPYYVSMSFFENSDVGHHVVHSIHSDRDASGAKTYNAFGVLPHKVIDIEYYPHSDMCFISTEVLTFPARYHFEDWYSEGKLINKIMYCAYVYACTRNPLDHAALIQAIVNLLSSNQL